MVSWSLNNSLPVYHTEPKDETHPCRLELLVVESGVVNFGLYLGVYLSSPLTWMAAAFGAVVGSFLNVCIFRIPEGTFFKHLARFAVPAGNPSPAGAIFLCSAGCYNAVVPPAAGKEFLCNTPWLN